MTRWQAATLIVPVIGSLVHSAVIPIAPFAGERSDPLNYPGTVIVPSFSIFADTASLDSHNGSTLIHYLLGDTFMGTVTPRTGSHILGFTEGPGIFRFDTPVRRFGAYFANNSGTADASCEFFDAGGSSLGALTAAIPAGGRTWTWNGWESDVPLARVVVTGNGVIDGFLWFDDLEVATVPSPGAGVLVGVLAWASRRKRTAHSTQLT